MPMPAYARRLIDARARGDSFWLVVVAFGALRDAAVLPGVPGVARLGCSPDVDPRGLDWRAVVGMDVLCTRYEGFAQPSLFTALDGIWLARPATVWLEGPPGRASRLMRFPSRAVGWVEWIPARVPIDAAFCDRLKEARDLTLAMRGPPLFDDAAFDDVRSGMAEAQAA